MLYDVVDDPASASAATLRSAYEDELRAAVAEVGVESAAEAAEVEPAVLERLLAGEDATLTLEESASVLALGDGMPDARTIELEVRDHLLMGMTTAVLDVDTIAANVDIDFSGKEVQQALEGRMPVTLAQLAAIHAFVASRQR